MPREIVLGNGEFLVNLDGDLSIRDIYYPYVGLYNHVGGYRCRIGVWTSDAGYSWLGDAWERSLAYRPGTLIADHRLRHRGLSLALHVEQCVPPGRDVFLQRITVENQSSSDREVRLFFAYDLRVAESDIGDTVFFNPYLSALVHYKRDNFFLVSGYVGEHGTPKETGIQQYACGIKEFGGAEGTWRDAEDGRLSMNAIAQGSVDSVIGFSMKLMGHGSDKLRSWLLAGNSLPQVGALQTETQAIGFDALMDETSVYAKSWTQIDVPGLSDLPEEMGKLFNLSLHVVRSHIDKRGAILASTDSDIMQTARAHYAYIWPRDGALTAYAMDRLGLTGVTMPFFRFCADALTESANQPYWQHGAALMHKYGPDGSLGASWHPWIIEGEGPEPPIQEDGTALVLWACARHCLQQQDKDVSEEMFTRLARPAADFLVGFRDKDTKLPLPSWDIWEERRGIHIYTVSAVIAALDQVSLLASSVGERKLAELYKKTAEEVRQAVLSRFWHSDLGRFARMLTRDADGVLHQDMTIDSSAYALFGFGALPADHPRVVATMQAIGRALWVKTGVGGLARYEQDYYFRVTDEFDKVPGNPWVICTLWLAEWTIATANSASDLRPALDLLKWATLCALPTGILPEQVNPLDHQPLSVAPLTWSHAQFITTTLNYLERLHSFTETPVKTGGPERR